MVECTPHCDSDTTLIQATDTSKFIDAYVVLALEYEPQNRKIGSESGSVVVKKKPNALYISGEFRYSGIKRVHASCGLFLLYSTYCNILKQEDSWRI